MIVNKIWSPATVRRGESIIQFLRSGIILAMLRFEVGGDAARCTVQNDEEISYRAATIRPRTGNVD